MTKLKQLLAALRDGSLPVRIYNRFSRVKYVPQTEITTADILRRNYPGDGWKALSQDARVAWSKHFPIFQQVNIRRVLHVGANDGGSALALNEAFPGMEFHLLEPIPHVFEKLRRNTQAFPNFHCHNLAAGATEEFLEMNIDEHSAFSSLLPYEKLALEQYPHLRTQQKAKVPVKPLDTVVAGLNPPSADLVVIDVQGFEDAVLKGAAKTLAGAKVVLIEMTLQKLYQGSSTFDSVYRKLVDAGFQLKFLLNPMKGTGNYMLQIDGVFIRESAMKEASAAKV